MESGEQNSERGEDRIPGANAERKDSSGLRYRVALGLLIAAIAVAGGIWFYGRETSPPKGDGVVWEAPIDNDIMYRDAVFAPEPMTFAAGVHMLGQSAPSVVYALETSKGLVLVDTSVDAGCTKVIQQMKTLGLDPARVVAILLTHVHGDHTLGARRFREMTGAKIYAGAGDADALRAGGPREAFFSTFAMDEYEAFPIPVDVELHGGELLDFGDMHIQAIATPGHTPGSICYLAERNHLSVLFGGDTISSFAADLGTYAAYLPPRYRGNARDYLASLRHLRDMPTPNLILPGHPTSPLIVRSPRLSESQWHQLLDRGIGEMQELVNQFEADGEDFLDGQPKELLPGLKYLGDYKSRAIYALITPDHRLVFDAPGDEGFAKFLTEQLQTMGVRPPAPTAILLTSCDPNATAGLDSVVKQFGCKVVAAPEGHDVIRKMSSDLMTLMTPSDLESAGWMTVQVIPLRGRGMGSVAYVITWEGKTVLVSGEIPATLNDRSVQELANALQAPTGDHGQYKQTLEALRGVQPQLWLLGTPYHGQNANLYDDQWTRVLDRNLKLFRQE